MPEENNSRSVFADRLRELRKISRMTQKQVAQILNLDRSTYAYYETDTTKPDYNTLVRIARMFRVSTDYMLGVTDTMAQGNRPEDMRYVLRDKPVEKGMLAGAEVIGDLDPEERAIVMMFRQLETERKEKLLQYVRTELQNSYSESDGRGSRKGK